MKGSWPWPGNFSGFGLGDVPEVREDFGNAALVQDDIRLNYNRNSELMVFICEDGMGDGTGICVAISNFSHSDPKSPLQISEFPDDAWMLEKFGLLFGLDEKASEEYLEHLKKTAQNQTWNAEIQVNESPDFPAVHAYLMENSDNSSYIPSADFYMYPTKGSDTKEVFFKDGNRLGSVRYFVPGVRVLTYDKGNRYIVSLDASGKVRLEIIMPPGSSWRNIPEEKYRAIFREIFEELGLPPDGVDSFEFFHSSSLIW